MAEVYQQALHVAHFYGEEYTRHVRRGTGRSDAAHLSRQRCLRWAMRCGVVFNLRQAA